MFRGEYSTFSDECYVCLFLLLACSPKLGFHQRFRRFQLGFLIKSIIMKHTCFQYFRSKSKNLHNPNIKCSVVNILWLKENIPCPVVNTICFEENIKCSAVNVFWVEYSMFRGEYYVYWVEYSMFRGEYVFWVEYSMFSGEYCVLRRIPCSVENIMCFEENIPCSEENIMCFE